MIIGIILGAFLGLGMGLFIYSNRYGILGGFLITIFGVLFILHVILISISSYEYEQYVVQRDAYVSTLQESRANGSELETAAVMKGVAEWNIMLASAQYTNSLILLDPYIDDRIDSLKPIK